MRVGFYNPNRTRTWFIQLNTRKCEACWRCIKSCPKNVIGKVDFPWHKHVLINKPDRCTGCFKCVKACEPGALSKI